MSDPIRESLDLGLWQPDPGATEKEIADAEQRVGTAFPDELRRLYLTCNGAEHPVGLARLLPLVELPSLQGTPSPYAELCIPLVPFAEIEQQDYLLITGGDVAPGLIVWWWHEGDPVLLFESVPRMLTVVGRDLTDDSPDPSELDHDFSGMQRQPRHREMAKAILALPPREEYSVDSALCAHLAAGLLGPQDLDLLERMMIEGDVAMRSASSERLRAIGGQHAEALLAKTRAEQAAFVRRCEELLRAAGITTFRDRHQQLRVESMSSGLNFEALYGMRHLPDFPEQLLGIVRRAIRSDSLPLPEAPPEPAQAEGFLARLRRWFVR